MGQLIACDWAENQYQTQINSLFVYDISKMQEVIYYIGRTIKGSQNARSLFMVVHIDQTKKPQGAFIVYQIFLFIRGKYKKLTQKWLVDLNLWLGEIKLDNASVCSDYFIKGNITYMAMFI